MRWAGQVARMSERRSAYGVLCGNLREGYHLQDSGVDGIVILKWIFEKWNGGMDLIDLAQDRDRWRSVVNAVMNIWVLQNAGNFLLAQDLLASQELVNKLLAYSPHHLVSLIPVMRKSIRTDRLAANLLRWAPYLLYYWVRVRNEHNIPRCWYWSGPGCWENTKGSASPVRNGEGTGI